MNKRSDLELHIVCSPARRGAGRGGLVMEFLLAVLLLLALGGALAAASGAPLTALLPPILVGAASCAVLVFASRAPWSKFVAPALLLLALLLSLCLRGRVTEGLCQLYNRWCAALTASTGRLRLGVTALGADAEAGMRAFLFAAALLLAVCAVALRRACPRAAAVLCLLLAVALALLPGLEGVGIRVALLLLVGLLLLLAQEAGSVAGPVQRLLPLVFACAVFALLLLGVRCFSPVRDGTLFAELRQRAAASLHAARYEPERQPLPEGDLTRVGPKSEAGTTRLLVSMTLPETLYLRGFVGDEYTGDGWRPVSNAELAEDSDLLFWLHRSGFYPQTQASLAQSLANAGAERNSVSVNAPGACSEYVYAPYSLSRSDALSWLPSDVLDVSALKAGGRMGLRQYRYSVAYRAPEHTGEWVDALNAAETAEVDAYRAQEAGYREFVLAHDLALPESARRLLGPLLDELSRDYGGPDALTPVQAVACVNAFLEQNLTYRTDVPHMGAASDFAAWTLNALGGGYDVHYATLTVLALRYYGVPARYAEGYLVTEEQAAEAQGQWIPLSDGCALAWAEVYQEGIGWLPLKQTPGYAVSLGDAPAAGDEPVPTSSEPDPDSPVGTATGEVEESEPSDAAEPEPPEGEQIILPNNDDGPIPENYNTPQTLFTKERARLLWLLPVLLVLLLLAGLYLRRRRVLLRRERLFGQEDPAQAVSCLFAYLLRLLEPLGIAPQKGRLLELPPLLAEKLEPEYAERFSRVTELNYRALFCSKPLPEGAREELSDFRGETLAQLRRGCGFWKRLRLKWLRCLY